MRASAYVAFDGHQDDDITPYLFKTTDGGATWTSIANDLPDVASRSRRSRSIRAIRICCFAGTEFGLYWSFDGGTQLDAGAAAILPPVRDRPTSSINPQPTISSSARTAAA